MPIVLVTDRIQQAGLDVLTERSDIVIARFLDPASEEELIHRVVNADATLARKIKRLRAMLLVLFCFVKA